MATRRDSRASQEPVEDSEAEELELRTADGVTLRATLREPPPREWPEPRGTMVLAHAAFARRVEWERPRGDGLAARLARRGYRALAFDFRGHGDSANDGPGVVRDGSARDGYDAFVRHDLPAVVACAKDRGGRVVVVGHSLGGHVALASQGLGLLGADGVLAVAANVWHPTFEPSLARQALKLGVATLMSGLTRGLGVFPARALRVGSDDARPSAVGAFLRTARDGSWRSDDARDDYLAALTRVDIPVCALLSEGDRLACLPESGRRFLSRVGGPSAAFVVRPSADGAPAPDHMGLVTAHHVGPCHAQWERALAWLEAELERRPVASALAATAAPAFDNSADS